MGNVRLSRREFLDLAAGCGLVVAGSTGLPRAAGAVGLFLPEGGPESVCPCALYC